MGKLIDFLLYAVLWLATLATASIAGFLFVLGTLVLGSGLLELFSGIQVWVPINQPALWTLACYGATLLWLKFANWLNKYSRVYVER